MDILSSFLDSKLIVYLLGLVEGFLLGYILYAPETPFKRGFVDGLTLMVLRYLWRKKKK